MTLKIGEKIKELREKKNITQCKMAEYLGITEQAISRWENGGGYPDMELIPAISNFLDVSTDELFETDKKEERLKNLKREAGKNLDWTHKSNLEAIKKYREILKEFPNDYQTMWHLAVHLGEENYNPLGQHSEEIIALSNRIIHDSPDINLRRVATNSLATAYKNIGNREIAIKTIKESSILFSVSDSIGFSRESILAYIAEGEEKWKSRKNFMQTLCNELCIYMRHFCLGDDVNEADKLNDEWLRRNIIIRKKINKIIETFYEDGDYGYLRESQVYVYLELAEYYMKLGEHEKALDNIEKCAETAIIFDTDKEGQHTSVLVENLKKYGDYPLKKYGNHAENIQYNQSYRLIHDWFLHYEFFIPLRENERFKVVITKLEQYAKVEKVD